MALRPRPLRAEDLDPMRRRAHARTAAARAVQRARLVWRADQGHRVPASAQALPRTPTTVPARAQALPAPGRDRGRGTAAIRPPGALQSRAGRRGARAHPGGLGWRAGRPRLRRQKGRITALYTPPPPGRIVVCLEARGPERAQRGRGQAPVPARERPSPARLGPRLTAPPARPGATTPSAGAASGPARPGGRAAPAMDEGRRGQGPVVGACTPAAGEAVPVPDAGRTTATAGDVLARVAAGMAPALERLDASRENRSAQRATEVVVCSRAHPRGACVCPPP